MAKFTKEEKFKAVQRFLKGNESCRKIANEIGVHHSSKNYTSYSLQYKLDVLKYMDENGTSIFETAAIFNLPSESTL